MFEVAFTLILHICFSLGESTVVAHHAHIKFGLISVFQQFYILIKFIPHAHR